MCPVDRSVQPITTSKPSEQEPDLIEHNDALALVAQAQAGSRAAFESIYRMYVGRVYAICLRMLANPTRVEEVTQKIFIRLWSKLNSYRGESRFSSWLYRLSVNVVLNELKCAEAKTDPSFAPIENHHPSTSNDETLKIMALDLDRAIALLPYQARIIFVLHDIEGLTHEEIAHAMKLAGGTCKAQLSRARRLLREMLKK